MCIDVFFHFKQLRGLLLNNMHLQCRQYKTNIIQLCIPIVCILFVALLQVMFNYVVKDLDLDSQIMQHKEQPFAPFDMFYAQGASGLKLNLTVPNLIMYTVEGNDPIGNKQIQEYQFTMLQYRKKDGSLVPYVTPVLEEKSSSDEIDSVLLKLIKQEKKDRQIPYLGAVIVKEWDYEHISYSLQFDFKDPRIKIDLRSKLFNAAVNSVSGLCQDIEILFNTRGCYQVIEMGIHDSITFGFQKNLTGGFYIMSFTQQIPYKEKKFKIHMNLKEILDVYFFPLILNLMLPVFMYKLVLEKKDKLKEMMRLMGVKYVNYVISNVIYMVVFYTLSVLVLIFMGWIFKYRFITQTNPVILLLIFCGSGMAVIGLAHCLSSILRDQLIATVIGYFWVLFIPVVAFVMNNYVMKDGIWKFKPLLAILTLPISDSIFHCAEGCQNMNCPQEFSQLWKNTDLMIAMIFLYVDAIVYFILGIYFDLVLPQEWGKRKSPLFCFDFLLKYIRCPSKVYFGELDPDEDIDVKILRDDIMEDRLTKDNRNVLIRGLTKNFGKNVAVNRVCFGVKKNEVFGLLGPNGAGKTTTIRCLVGLFDQTSGEAFISGRPISSEMEGIRKSLGYCPQFDIQWEELTPREHLLFYARIKGVPICEENDQVNRILRSTGLDESFNKGWLWKTINFFWPLEKAVNELSGGMKRRLSIGISLCGDPGVVFLDEPTTGLDPSSKRQIWNIILNEKKNKSILITTHSMEEADVLSDTIGIMSKGNLVCCGSSLHLKGKYGTGYTLSVNSFDHDLSVPKIEELLNPYCRSRIISSFGEQLTWELSPLLIKEEQQLQIIPKEKEEEEDNEEDNEKEEEGEIIQVIEEVKEEEEEEEVIVINEESYNTEISSSLKESSNKLKEGKFKVSSVFRNLHEKQEECGVVSWHLNQTTLEDVFLNVIKKAQQEEIEKEKKMSKLDDDKKKKKEERKRKKKEEKDALKKREEYEDLDDGEDFLKRKILGEDYNDEEEEKRIDEMYEDDDDDDVQQPPIVIGYEDEGVDPADGRGRFSINEPSDIPGKDAEESDKIRLLVESSTTTTDVVDQKMNINDTEDDDDTTTKNNFNFSMITPYLCYCCSCCCEMFLHTWYLLKKDIRLTCRDFLASCGIMCSPVIPIFVIFLLSKVVVQDHVIPNPTPLDGTFFQCWNWGDNHCYTLTYATDGFPLGEEVMNDFISDHRLIEGEDYKKFGSCLEMDGYFRKNSNVSQNGVCWNNTVPYGTKYDEKRIVYTVYYNTTTIDLNEGDSYDNSRYIKMYLDNLILYHLTHDKHKKPNITKEEEEEEENNEFVGQHYDDYKEDIVDDDDGSNKSKKKKRKNHNKLIKPNKNINRQRYFDVDYKPFPHIPASTNGQNVIFSAAGPNLISLSSMLLLIVVIQKLVMEKEKGLKQAMVVVGMRRIPYYCSFFLIFCCFSCCMSIIVVLVGMIFVIYPFIYCNQLILLILFFMFDISLVSFGFCLSSLITSRRTGIIVGFVVFSCCCILNAFLANGNDIYLFMDTKSPQWVPLFFEIFYPTWNFAKALSDIIHKTVMIYDPISKKFEKNDGFGFSDLFKENTFDYDFNLVFKTQPTIFSFLFLGLNSIMFMFFFVLITWVLQMYSNGWTFLYFFQKFCCRCLFKSRMSSQNQKVLDEMDEDLKEEHSLANDQDQASSSVLRLQQIAKTYYKIGGKKTKAVKSVSLAIPDRCCFSLLGHNGAGKSTTINLITGYHNLTSGNVFLHNKSVKRNLGYIRKNIGVCHQADVLFPKLTAQEHLQLFAEIQGKMSYFQIKKEIEYRLKQVSLWGVRNDYVKTFSGGMKRRLSVAISCIGNPNVALLDEPTTGMDPYSRSQVWDLIMKLKKEKVIFLTTHSMEEADALSDKIGIMTQGVLKCVGNSLHLKQKYGSCYILKLTARKDKEEKLLDLLDSFFKGKVKVTGADLIYKVRVYPQWFFELHNLLEELEREEEDKENGCVKNFGLTHTSLEDVYIKVTKLEDIGFEIDLHEDVVSSPVTLGYEDDDDEQQDDRIIQDDHQIINAEDVEEEEVTIDENSPLI